MCWRQPKRLRCGTVFSAPCPLSAGRPPAGYDASSVGRRLACIGDDLKTFDAVVIASRLRQMGDRCNMDFEHISSKDLAEVLKGEVKHTPSCPALSAGTLVSPCVGEQEGPGSSAACSAGARGLGGRGTAPAASLRHCNTGQTPDKALWELPFLLLSSRRDAFYHWRSPGLPGPSCHGKSQSRAGGGSKCGGEKRRRRKTAVKGRAGAAAAPAQSSCPSGRLQLQLGRGGPPSPSSAAGRSRSKESPAPGPGAAWLPPEAAGSPARVMGI